MNFFPVIRDALLHFIFPHLCEGCGSDRLNPTQLLCLRCLSTLPHTDFHLYPANPVEKIFWGRIPVTHATAQYYFTKGSMMQRLLHQFKYHGNKDLGFYLGQLMGNTLIHSNRFSFLDALIPLPLFESRERLRGFNQANILCKGIADKMGLPVLEQVVQRTALSASQTKKGRIERWQNMENRFKLRDAILLEGKQVLLVDDIITTGATLEACAREILTINQVTLNIATLCISSGF